MVVRHFSGVLAVVLFAAASLLLIFLPVWTYAAPVATGTFPTPPATPRCVDRNALANDIVRAGGNDALASRIFCRTLVQNGQYIYYLTNQLTFAQSVGVEALFDLGVQQAVDIFSPDGLAYYQNGFVMCLRGQGTLIWLAASGAPRHPEVVGSYTVREFPGYTCVTLFEPGTLVLVRQVPE